MSWADVLPIFGAVTGGFALIVTLRREWLDRPRLAIVADPMTEPDGKAWIITTVDNHGRQPVTVKQIGLGCRIEDAALPGGPEIEVLLNDPWSRERVEPGGHTQVHWQVPPKLDVHADAPLRPFAAYGRRRRLWGRPLAYYRLLLVMGWTPDDPHPDLIEPRHGVAAKSVEPWWKLWKPSYLRRDTVPPQVEVTRERVEEIRRALLEGRSPRGDQPTT
jgi:hypothetical protein